MSIKFTLIRPCELCPFRTDCLKGWLKTFSAEIADSLKNDKTFLCHETTEYEEDYDEDEYETPPLKETGKEQHCAGAMILLEKIERPNQMMRIAERLGLYDHTKLDMDAPVFNSLEEFVEHHMECKEVLKNAKTSK